MANWFNKTKACYARQHPAVKVFMVVAGGAVAAGAGLVAAPIVGAAASAAGLGVAGGTLSGAAASSAGLAALGGGSLASGGLGMAGGTIVVGAVTGTGGAGAAATVSRLVTKTAERRAAITLVAESQEVQDGEIRFGDDS